MKQKLLSGFGGLPNATSIRYYALSSSSLNPNSSETPVQQVFPTAGILRKFYVQLNTAVTNAGASYAVSIRKNGTTDYLTLTFTTNGGETQLSEVVTDVLVSIDDKFDVKVEPSGTPSNTPTISWIIEFESSTANEVVLLSAGSTLGTTAGTTYIPAMGVITPNATETNVVVVMPCAGNISAFHSVISADTGAGNSRVFKISINGTPSDSTALTFNNTGTSKNAAFNIAINAGDRLTIQQVISGTPTAANGGFGILFKPTIDGTFPIVWTCGTSQLTAGTTNYAQFAKSTSRTSTESSAYGILGDDFVVVSMYVWVDVEVTVGSLTITARKDASDVPTVPNTMTCQISSGQSGNDVNSSHEFTPVLWAEYATKIVLAASTPSERVFVSYAGFIQTSNPNDMKSFGDNVEWD